MASRRKHPYAEPVVPRGRGRPRKVWITTSIPPAVDEERLFGPSSNPSHSPNPSSVIETDAEPASFQPLDQAMIALRAGHAPPVPGARKTIKPFLKSYRNPGQGRKWKTIDEWQYRESITTSNIVYWFEKEPQDYNKYKNMTSTCVDQTWVGHPGTTPEDWRARPFLLKWTQGPHMVESTVQESAKLGKAVVAYAVYICAGAHRRGSGPDERGRMDKEDRKAQALEKEQALETRNGGTEGGTPPRRRPRHAICKEFDDDHVMLLLEIDASNLDVTHIYQLYTHDPLDVKKVPMDMSRRIKNYIEMRFASYHGLTFTTTAGIIRNELKPRFQDPLRPIEEWCPDWRIGLPQQVTNIGNAARLRQNFDEDPLLVVELIASLQSHNTFCYKPILRDGDDIDFGEELFTPQEAKRYKELCSLHFTFGLKTNFSLENIIIWAPINGLLMDSSYRNKNEYKAPLYLLATANLDDNTGLGHFLPGGAVVSQSAGTYACIRILASFQAALLELCVALVDGNYHPVHKRKEEVQGLFDHARKFLKQNGIVAKLFMTDKNLPQIRAAQLVMPHVPIRLCQFHVIQALIRWQTQTGKRIEAPQLPASTTMDIIVAFTRLQRCSDEDEWPEMEKTFFQALDDALQRAAQSDEPHDHLTDEEDVGDSAEVDTPRKKRASKSGKTATRSRQKDKGPIQQQPADETNGPDDDYEPLDDDLVGNINNTPKPRLSRKLTVANVKAWTQRLRYYFKRYWFTKEYLPLWTDMGLPPGTTRDGDANTNNRMEAAFKVFDSIFLQCRKNKRIDRLICILLKEWFSYYETWNVRPEYMEKADPPSELLELYNAGYDLWDRGLVEKAGAFHYRVTIQMAGGGPPRYITHIVDLEKSRCTCDSHDRTGKNCVHLIAADMRHTIGDPAEMEAVETREGRKKVWENRKNLKNLERERPPYLCYVEPRKAILTKEDMDPEPDDRHPELRPQRERRLRDDLVNDRLFSMLGALRSGPDRLSKPTNANPVIEPLRVWKANNANTYKQLMSQGGDLFEKRQRLLQHFETALDGGNDENEHRGPQLEDPEPLDNSDDLAESVAIQCECLTTGEAPRNVESTGLPAADKITSTGDPNATWDTERGFVTLDCRRWFRSDYWVADGEARVFVDLLNSLAMAVDPGVMFINPNHDFLSKLLELDWSARPGTADEETKLYAKLEANGIHRRRGGTPDLILLLREANKRRADLRKIVIWHLDVQKNHWVLFVHDLNDQTVTCFQSMNSNVDVDVWSQVVLVKFLTTRPPRGPGKQKRITNYLTIKLNCQRDLRSCGWFCLWESFGLLFGYSITPMSDFVHTSADTIRKNTRTIVQHFFGDAGGLKRWTLDRIFAMNDRTVPWKHAGDLGDVVAQMSPTLGRVSDSDALMVSTFSQNMQFVLQLMQNDNVKEELEQLGVSTADFQDVTGRRPLRHEVFEAAIAAIIDIGPGVETMDKPRPIVLNAEAARWILSYASDDGLPNAMADESSDGHVSMFADVDGYIPDLVLIPFADKHACLARISFSERTVDFYMAVKCASAVQCFEYAIKAFIKSESRANDSPLKDAAAAGDWCYRATVPASVCEIRRTDERRWVLSYLLAVLEEVDPGSKEWADTPMTLQQVHLTPSLLLAASLPSVQDLDPMPYTLFTFERDPPYDGPLPQDGTHFMHWVGDRVYPAQVNRYDPSSEELACRYHSFIRPPHEELDPFPNFTVPISCWNRDRERKFSAEQVCWILKPRQVVPESDPESRARIWPILSSVLGLAASILDGIPPPQHEFSCLMELDQFSVFVTPRDFATLEHFAQGALDAGQQNESYQRVIQLFAATIVYQEVRGRPLYANLTPQRFVEELNQGSFLERTDYFEAVEKLIHETVTDPDSAALQACFEVVHDDHYPILDFHINRHQPPQTAPPLPGRSRATSPRPTRVPPSPGQPGPSPQPTRVSAGPARPGPQLGNDIAETATLKTNKEAARLAQAEETTVVMTIGNALPFKLNAGALDRLLKPGQIIIDDSINAYISSLEEQMHVDRCFVWHTYMHTHICEKYWNPLPDGDIDDFFQHVKISAFDRLVFPVFVVSLTGIRFAVVSLNMQTKCVEYYDPEPCDCYLNWLEGKWKNEHAISTPFPRNQWQRAVRVPEDVPQHVDPILAGVQCAAAVRRFIQGFEPTISGGFSWTAEDNSKWRQSMVEDIMSVGAIQEHALPTGIVHGPGVVSLEARREAKSGTGDSPSDAEVSRHSSSVTTENHSVGSRKKRKQPSNQDAGAPDNSQTQKGSRTEGSGHDARDGLGSASKRARRAPPEANWPS